MPGDLWHLQLSFALLPLQEAPTERANITPDFRHCSVQGGSKSISALAMWCFKKDLPPKNGQSLYKLSEWYMAIYGHMAIRPFVTNMAMCIPEKSIKGLWDTPVKSYGPKLIFWIFPLNTPCIHTGAWQKKFHLNLRTFWKFEPPNPPLERL